MSADDPDEFEWACKREEQERADEAALHEEARAEIMAETIPVIQVDREAAADLHRAIYGSHWDRADEVDRQFRAGELDDDPTVQAFARHRLHASREMEEALDALHGAIQAQRARFIAFDRISGGLLNGVQNAIWSGMWRGEGDVQRAFHNLNRSAFPRTEEKGK